MLERILFFFLFILILIQFFQSDQTMAIFLLILQIGLLFWLWIRNFSKRNSKNKESSSTECSQKMVNLLRLYRHDWLNHLQILLGYASLKKVEKIAEYINNIFQESKQQSLISSFRSPDLAAFLLMLPMEYPNLSVQLDVAEHVVKQEGLYVEWVLKKLKCFLNLFHQSANEQKDYHQIFLSFVLSEGSLILNFEIEGNMESVYQDIIDAGKQFEEEGGVFNVDLYNEKELIMELHFSLKGNGGV